MSKYIGGTFLKPNKFGFVFEKEEYTLVDYISKEKPSFLGSLKIVIPMIISLCVLEKYKKTRPFDYENVFVTKGKGKMLMDFFPFDENYKNNESKILGVDKSYLAPELRTNKKTTEFDVGDEKKKSSQFSLAILIWGIINHKLTGICEDENKRPSLDGKVFKENKWLKKLLERMWSKNIDERPTFDEILGIIINFMSSMKKKLQNENEGEKESNVPEIEEEDGERIKQSIEEKENDVPNYPEVPNFEGMPESDFNTNESFDYGRCHSELMQYQSDLMNFTPVNYGSDVPY